MLRFPAQTTSGQIPLAGSTVEIKWGRPTNSTLKCGKLTAPLRHWAQVVDELDP